MLSSTLNLEFLDLLSDAGIWFQDLKQPDTIWLGPKLRALLQDSKLEAQCDLKTFTQLIYPEDLDVFAQIKAHSTQGTGGFEILFRYRGFSGQPIWTRLRFVPHYEDGELIGICATHGKVFENVTIQESLRRLYEHTPALMHASDHEGRIEFVTDLWLETFGYERHEVIGRRAADMLAPESLPLIPQLIERYSRDGHIQGAELVWLCKDGSTRDIILSSSGELGDRGQFIRSRAVLLDVTDLKKAQARAQKERSMRDRFFESVPDAIFIKDPQRHIVDTNPHVAHIFGWTREELIGQSAALLFDNLADFERIASDESEQLHNHITYKRKDGTTFIGDMVRTTIFDDDGHVEGIIEIVRDVSQLIQSIEQLKRTNTRLEGSLRTLDQFAYIASHDLRTPLRGIQHIIRFLQEDSPKELLPLIQTRLDQVMERTTLLDNMLQSLLALVRAEHDNASTMSDFKELITSVERFLDVELTHQRKLAIHLELAPELQQPVMLPNVALTHILSNLISNSIKHHDGELVNITIRARIEHGDTLSIEVEDDGPGIAPRYQERVFEIFRTLNKTSGGSTGIGLALVKRLVVNLDGELSLVSPSQAQRGCKFLLSIPYHKPLTST